MRWEIVRCSSPTCRYRPGLSTWRSANFDASSTKPTNTTASSHSRRTRDLFDRDGGAGGRGGVGGRRVGPGELRGGRGRGGEVRRDAVRERGVAVAVISRSIPLSG